MGYRVDYDKMNDISGCLVRDLSCVCTGMGSEKEESALS